MKDKKIAIVFRSWVIGMVVVVVYFMLHLQHFFIGLLLGIINTFFTDRFVDSMINGNKTTETTNKKLLIEALKNIIIAISISMVIRGIDYILLLNHIFEIPIEPFRFILYYQIIYYGCIFIIRKWTRRKKHVKNNKINEQQENDADC